MAARPLAVLAFLLIFAVSLSALAASTKDEQAHAAYGAGAAAYDAQDFEEAAAQFARADQLTPNLTALKLALAAAVRAGRADLAMNLVFRAEARSPSDGISDLVRATRDRFASQVGLVRALCRPFHECTISVAGHAAVPGTLVACSPGEIYVTFASEGLTRSKSALIAAGQTVEVDEPKPPLPAATQPSAHEPQPASTAMLPAPLALSFRTPSAAENSAGLPRTVFWSGVALSTALLAASAASRFDMVSARRAFLADRNDETRERGQDAVVRSNVLLTVTIASAVATTLIGLFYTRWHHRPTGQSRLGPAWSAVVGF